MSGSCGNLKWLSQSGGFTLVETIVSMAILAAGLVVITQSWSGNINRIEKAQINAVTANLMQMKMTELELKYRNKPIKEIEEALSGDFGGKYPAYSWEMSAQDFNMPDLSAGFTAREGGADQLLLTIVKTITETINKTVKEITLTVTYKSRAGRTLKNSATTYFVDQNAQLSLGGP